MAAGGPEGKGLRLSQIESWPRPLPRPRAIEGWTLLVTKLHKGTTKYFLRETFGEVGEVTRLRLNLDDDLGFPKGSALIEYKKFDEALAAITTLNLNGKISVEWANERDGVPIRLFRAEGTIVRRWYVLVTRLRGKVQEADLQYLFGKYGEVTSIQMNRCGYIRFPKGYAFIEYKHREVARWAMKLWNGSDFFGDIISVRWADDHCHVYREIPAGSLPDRLLLVTGLTERVVAAELHRQFGIYGEIINFKTYDGILDVVEGYALIEYKRFKEARAAISGADQNELHGQTILVNWANKMKPTYINVLLDDMMRNIFLRLPLHSIFHCSRVCKRWKHIIGDRLFEDMHHDLALKNHGINPSMLFLVDGDEGNPSFVYFFRSGFKRRSGVRGVCNSAYHKMRVVRLSPLPNLHSIPRVIGSSNGLLCYVHSCHCIGVTHDVAHVTNPLTKKFARFARHCDEILGPSRLIGFGFDVNEKKFKLVSLTEEVVGSKELEADRSAHPEKKLKKELKKELKVDILTIGDDVHPDDCKRINISQDSFYSVFPQLSDAKFSSLVMNGCLYWCYLYSSSPLIIALHMRLNLFIDIPVGDLVLTGDARFLMDWKGKLAIADVVVANSIELLPAVKIWVREDGKWIGKKVYSWHNPVMLPNWIEVWSRSFIAYWPFDNDDFLHNLLPQLGHGHGYKIRRLFTNPECRFTVVPHVGSLSSFGFLK